MQLNSEQINAKIEVFLAQPHCNHQFIAEKSNSLVAEQFLNDQQFSASDAAIMVLLQKQKSWHIVLTQKAKHLNKHAGQVAFPGGKHDHSDPSILATAYRETEEEIGIGAHLIKPFYAIEPQVSRYNIKVYPFLAVLDHSAQHAPNCDEITHSFNVPIDFFINTKIIHQQVSDELEAPCWVYEEFRIWGFTAAVIAYFIKLVFDVETLPIFDFRPSKIKL